MKDLVIDTLIYKACSAIDEQIRPSIKQHFSESLNYFLQDSDVEQLSQISDNYDVKCKPCTIVQNNDGSITITINIHPLDFTIKQQQQQNTEQQT